MHDRIKGLQHGGNIYDRDIRHDLSVNINPAGMPDIISDALRRGEERIGCYPEYGAVGLRRNIGECFCFDPDNIVCGNGASEILSVLGRLYEDRKVLIPVPSFVGYERAFAGADIEYLYLDQKRDFAVTDSLLDEIDRVRPEVLLIGNPNNPTGKLIDRELLLRLVGKCRDNDCRLIIDESFIELADGGESNSIINEVRENECIVLIRSVTKSFAVPGVRLGYMICTDDSLCDRVRSLLPEWNISVFADETGKAIFTWSGREEYLKRSEETVRVHRNRIENALAEKGYRYIRSDCNYVMFEADVELYDRLLKNGLLIRRCPDYRGLQGNWYRVAVSADSACIVFLRSL